MPDSLPDDQSLARIEHGLVQFNEGKFFECHDTLEDVWRGTRGPLRDCLQGIIHVAVGFYHLDAGNLRGTVSQFEKGLARLEPFGQGCLGIDLADLRLQVTSWLNKIRSGEHLAPAPHPHISRS
jgi:predicted metal-dependent hydrolase